MIRLKKKTHYLQIFKKHKIVGMTISIFTVTLSNKSLTLIKVRDIQKPQSYIRQQRHSNDRLCRLPNNQNKHNLCIQICSNTKSDCSSTGEHEIIVVTQLSANHLILAALLHCLYKPEWQSRAQLAQMSRSENLAGGGNVINSAASPLLVGEPRGLKLTIYS